LADQEVNTIKTTLIKLTSSLMCVQAVNKENDRKHD
jgi:hypothetical protein